MKTSIIVGMVTLVIWCGCKQQPRHPLEGTWELVIGKPLGIASEPQRPLSPHWRSIKIIGKHHFATIWQDTTATGFWSSGFNGGEYVFKNNQYTEHYHFFSEKGILGAKPTFSVSVNLERNVLIITYERKNNKGEISGFYEEWKRLE